MTRAHPLPSFCPKQRVAPSTRHSLTQSGSAAAALALAVTLLVVTLYLVEQRCRGVICPSELLGSQNRIGALWKSPHHHLACCPACKPDNVWIWVSNPPWVLWRFLGSSITRTTTRSTMHRGVILNTTQLAAKKECLSNWVHTGPQLYHPRGFFEIEFMYMLG